MIDINEKISALYDGELKDSEIDDLIKIINEDKDLQKKLSFFNLIEYASNYNIKKTKYINTKKVHIKDILFNKVWVSNALTAAATVILTLTVTNNYDFSRLDENIESSNKINSAINSIEAQNIIKRSEEYLTDHIMRVLNDPSYMNSQENVDLRNVVVYVYINLYTKVKIKTGRRVKQLPFARMSLVFYIEHILRIIIDDVQHMILFHNNQLAYTRLNSVLTLMTLIEK